MAGLRIRDQVFLKAAELLEKLIPVKKQIRLSGRDIPSVPPDLLQPMSRIINTAYFSYSALDEQKGLFVRLVGFAKRDKLHSTDAVPAKGKNQSGAVQEAKS